MSGLGCCGLAVSSALLFSDSLTTGGSVLGVALQSLFTLERRRDPSAVEMTLLARGRALGDLGLFRGPSFPTGLEKQLRQPDIEDDLPRTHSTVTGDTTVARIVSASALLRFDELEFIPLGPVLIFPWSPESDEQRVTFLLDPLRITFVPLVSQKS